MSRETELSYEQMLAAKDATHEKQLNAHKSLIQSLENQRTTLWEGAEKWAEAVKSLLSEREANSLLTNEIDALTFVERWANHHAQKPHVTAAEALSCIRHYPEIEAITESYADGKVPETRDPYAEIAALQQEVDNALALWTVAHAERSEAMSHGARLEAEIAALKAERDALLKDAEWYDCKGLYAIEETDLDADMQAQAVKS